MLGNWDTYKDILNTFNSEQAVGSAFRETQKDVESWSGQLNILKNNWDEFINAVINSNTAINTLKGFSSVLNGLVAVSDKLGGLGTVATLISGVAGAKGSGIISSIQQYSRISKSIAGITTEDVAMLRQYNALIGQGVSVSEASAQALNGASESARRLATNANGAAVSEEVLNRAQNKLTLGARAGAVATRALGVALNVAFNMAVVAIISAIIKGLDELIVTQKEAAQLAEEQRQNALDAMSAYEAESTALNDVVSQYTKVISSTSDLSSQKEQLLNLQNQLPDSYKEEAEGIDLVNGKISDNIALLNELERKKADQYVRDNQGAYEIAQQELTQRTSYSFNAKGIKSFAGDKRVRDYLLSIEKISKDTDSWSGLSSDSFRDFTIENATLDEQVQILSQIRDFYKDLEGHNATWLDQLDDEVKRLQKIVDADNNLIDGMKEQQKIASLTAQEYNLINQATLAYREYQTSLNSENKDEAQNALSALYNVKDVVYSMTDSSSALRTQFDELWNTFTIGAKESVSSIEEVRADFTELSGEAFDKELKNVEDISKAIDSLLNGENLSHEDAWKLLNLDTEGVLADIEIINGQYKLSTDQLVALMEQQINKQKESIETTKAQAVEELNLLKIQLRRLKVNSPSDVAAYKSQLEKITGDMRDMQDIIDGSDLLLQELNGHLNKTYAITGTIATSLTNAVKQFEAEVKAIDNAIDSLNDRKEVLQDEKSILQDQLDVLNEQKKTIEDTIANYDKVGEAVNDLVQAQVEGIQSQIDALEEERKAIEDYYEEQLDALKEQNEERDDAIEKEEALANLADAQSKKKRVYSSARGWTYESSKEDILNAQNALAKIATNEQIKALEKERDSKLGEFDDRKKDYESQIKSYQEYAKQYTSVSDDIKKAENELLADQILGSEWREKIEQKDEGLLTKYRAQYASFNEQLTNLTNNEIATLQASIDAKDAEIKKVDDEVKAYNRYKSTVQKSLADAKTALENYKNSMNTTKQDIIDAWEGMEHEGWDRSWKMESYNNKIASSAESARDRIVAAYRDIENALSMFDRFQDSPTGFGIVNSSGDAELLRKLRNLGYYDNGGTNSYTGLAMLHGTPQRSETIFNANDSKKLYDMIHNTPNLMADMVKKASRSIGFTPVNNTNSNSVNVHIGQIVANNPREFTQGLDRELDSYFRRKLTASYVQ